MKYNHSLFLYIILVLLLLPGCRIQRIASDAKPVAKSETSFDKSSISIELYNPASDQITFLGSGILYLGRTGVILGLTNAHLFNGISGNQIILIGYNNDDSNKVYLKSKIQKIDATVDLCALTVSDIFSNTFQKVDLQKFRIDSTRYIVKERFSDEEILRLGEDVVYVGYPLSIGSMNVYNKPIVRKGSVAQNKIGGIDFLLDGTANRGNSGSAIYDAENYRFLGLVKGRSEEYSILRITDTTEIKYANNSGLIHCISALTILNFLGEYK